MMKTTRKIQKRIAMWVEQTLGPKSMQKHERGLRLVEEAVELGQALGVTENQAQSIIACVYTKPVGHVEQELGGCGITLAACAESALYDLGHCINKEMDRIEILDSDKIRNRQRRNVLSGIGVVNPD